MSSELYRKMQPFLGDEQELYRRMAGQMDLWEECVRLFPGREIITTMDSLLQREDDTDFYKEVHRLKGNLANFGFDNGAVTATAVLQAIKENNRAQRDACYFRLREEYLKIIERIGEVNEA